MDLVVKSPFDGHEIGDRITDAERVAAIRGDHRAEFVIQIASVEAAPAAEVVPVKAEPVEHAPAQEH